MNFNSSHGGPGAGAFRAPNSAAGHSGDAAPTERLTSLGQQGGHRLVAPPAAGQQGRTQRTRRTVDLPAATHRALDIWQREAADRLGVARVTGQEVLTALIDQLLVDPKLTAQITRAIKDRR
ncbi:ATPase [Mycobacterium sp. 94-17]|uniref:ATPase n=1 Tax=Mycobacterium sp. 94-17 TaxID=2986147 RepID=UPI002D1E5CE6|nr:ATPase [Mycobacterium sp. 94-17]MEB4208962.1 ATPase [Mycobacterium sp. 94-17]